MSGTDKSYVETYKSIRVGRIEDLGRNGQSGHFQRLNSQGEVTLDSIARYLLSRTNMSKRSISTLSCAIKTSMCRALGPDYKFDPSVKYVVDQFFADYACNDKSARARHRCTLEELQLFMQRCSPRVGFFAEFLWLTGIRVTPMCNLKLKDLEWVEGVGGAPDTVEFQTEQKNGAKNRVLLLADFVRQVQRFFRGDVYLFETTTGKPYNRKAVTAMIREQSERYMNVRMTAHSFRHAMLNHWATRDRDRFHAACNQAGIEPQTADAYYAYDLLTPEDLQKISLWKDAK